MGSCVHVFAPLGASSGKHLVVVQLRCELQRSLIELPCNLAIAKLAPKPWASLLCLSASNQQLSWAASWAACSSLSSPRMGTQLSFRLQQQIKGITRIRFALDIISALFLYFLFLLFYFFRQPILLPNWITRSLPTGHGPCRIGTGPRGLVLWGAAGSLLSLHAPQGPQQKNGISHRTA